MKLSKDIERKIFQSNVEDSIARATGLPIISFTLTPPCPKSEVEWFKPETINSDDLKIVRCIEIYGVDCLWVATRHDETGDKFDLILSTKRFGFQILPKSLEDAFSVPNESKLDDAVEYLSMEWGVKFPSYEYFHGWLNRCLEMNGYVW